ncbi:pantoate--beta-alanine ligase [Salana multivorans]|uniref:Pantothenate synthetase n=1 Tax=Salana multivorans TaxID=120377 RepID=A0A3N2D8M8_9MICO|nr:pantoate--beta-alanine ligase [Salana multivorans]
MNSSSTKPGRLAVGILGAGRVGAVLGNALRAEGHEVVAVSGASPETRERVEALLPGVPLLDLVEVARRADLVLVCVPDDAIADVVAWVAQQGGFRPGQLVVHTSGRHGTGVLRPALAAGAIPLAIHPAMTFTGTSLDLARLVGTPFAVTAAAPVQPIGQALVVELGGEPVLLPEDSRAGYHAALAHASNHLVTLLVQAQEILRAAGVTGTAPSGEEQDAAGGLLGPLARAALDGALGSGAAALTGPVSRGDAGTVAEHLAAIEALVGPDGAERALLTYRALADATAVLAEHERRIDPDRAAAIRRLLRESEDAGDAAGVGTGVQPASVAVLHTITDLRAARRRLAGTVAVVPTMGALHEGHLALVRAARGVADHVVVTVFVNPTQFGDPGDLAAYPRTLDADVASLAALGADAPDLVFAPSAHEMYPEGATRVTIDPGPVANALEGASRPGHFAGVLTVVSKLFHLVRPDVAVFGQKDAQQLALVQRMVRDLDLDLWVLEVPIVREPDGLALSSRNVRLTPDGRRRALALSRSVAVAQRLAAAGADLAQVLAAARAELDDVEVDYATVVDPETYLELRPDVTGDRRAGTDAVGPGGRAAEPRYVVAALVDGVRLIDNGPVALGSGSVSSPGD